MIPLQAALKWAENKQLKSLKDVNNGECENFAMDFLHLFPNGDIVGTDNFVELFGKDWPGGHIWIMSDDKHYDSETLEGVSNWRDLPFFTRNRGSVSEL